MGPACAGVGVGLAGSGVRPGFPLRKRRDIALGAGSPLALAGPQLYQLRPPATGRAPTPPTDHRLSRPLGIRRRERDTGSGAYRQSRRQATKRWRGAAYPSSSSRTGCRSSSRQAQRPLFILHPRAPESHAQERLIARGGGAPAGSLGRELWVASKGSRLTHV